jgi:hypothetical protein
MQSPYFAVDNFATRPVAAAPPTGLPLERGKEGSTAAKPITIQCDSGIADQTKSSLSTTRDAGSIDVDSIDIDTIDDDFDNDDDDDDDDDSLPNILTESNSATTASRSIFQPEAQGASAAANVAGRARSVRGTGLPDLPTEPQVPEIQADGHPTAAATGEAACPICQFLRAEGKGGVSSTETPDAPPDLQPTSTTTTPPDTTISAEARRDGGHDLETRSLVSKLFRGEMRVQLEHVDDARCQRKQTILEAFQCLTLDVEPGDVLLSLAHFVQPSDVDYKTAGGLNTKGARRVWLERLPHALALHLQRVHYDRETFSVRKINTPFVFPARLDMGRYTYANRGIYGNFLRRCDGLSRQRMELWRHLKELCQPSPIEAAVERLWAFSHSNTLDAGLDSAKRYIMALSQPLKVDVPNAGGGAAAQGNDDAGSGSPGGRQAATGGAGNRQKNAEPGTHVELRDGASSRSAAAESTMASPGTDVFNTGEGETDERAQPLAESTLQPEGDGDGDGGGGGGGYNGLQGGTESPDPALQVRGTRAGLTQAMTPAKENAAATIAPQPASFPVYEDIVKTQGIRQEDIRDVLQGLRGVVALTRFQIAQELQHLDAQLQQERAPPSRDAYRLHAVFVHEGAPTVGHYKAYVRGAKPWLDEMGQAPDQWFCFNDSVVEEVTLADVEASGFGGSAGSTRNAYLLMYVLDRPWSGTLSERAQALRMQVQADDEEEDNDLMQLAQDLESSTGGRQPDHHSTPAARQGPLHPQPLPRKGSQSSDTVTLPFSLPTADTEPSQASAAKLIDDLPTHIYSFNN